MREQGANFLPVSGSISSAFSSKVWFLPKEISSPSLLFQMETGLIASWTTCCRSLSPSFDSTAHQEQWPAIPGLRFPKETPQKTAKGPVERKWKSQSSIHRLKSTILGHRTFYFPWHLQLQNKRLEFTDNQWNSLLQLHPLNKLRCWLSPICDSDPEPPVSSSLHFRPNFAATLCYHKQCPLTPGGCLHGKKFIFIMSIQIL